MKILRIILSLLIIFITILITYNLVKGLDFDLLEYLDKKTLSKTADVYRSFEDEKFYKRKLELNGFRNVKTIQANPLPLIRPLDKILEKCLTFFYICYRTSSYPIHN